jgi:hypothetical protein
MASNNRFYKQPLLKRLANFICNSLAALGALVIARAAFDGGDVLTTVKFYSVDFIYNIFLIIITGS